MIITRSPLRITLGGGGSDLPSYYREHGGFLIAAAIDKYVFVTVMRPFIQGIFLKYSKLEHVQQVKDIEHPIIRESIQMLDFKTPQMEITTLADIPAGTGLGSSGSFTTALLKALHTFKKNLIHPKELAQQACDIEINKLGEPIGKQDQYIAAYGGVTCFEFQKDGNVEAWPLKISHETLYNLEDNLLLFFTGYSRSASSILKEQNDKSKNKDHAMIENLHFVKELGYRSKDALEAGDFHELARIMREHWDFKKKRSGLMSNSHIDELYELGITHGAMCGKLIGAGGGGFLMFYTEDKKRLRHTMAEAGLEEVRMRFDFEGTKVVVQA